MQCGETEVPVFARLTRYLPTVALAFQSHILIPQRPLMGPEGCPLHPMAGTLEMSTGGGVDPVFIDSIVPHSPGPRELPSQQAPSALSRPGCYTVSLLWAFEHAVPLEHSTTEPSWLSEMASPSEGWTPALI